MDNVLGTSAATTADAASFARLFGTLRGWIVNRYPSLSSDADEIVAESLSLVLRRTRSGMAPDNLTAYLTATTHNVAIGALRRKGRTETTSLDDYDPPNAPELDPLDQIVGQMVSHDLVHEAFEAARSWRAPDGSADRTAVRVLTAYLDLASDHSPTVRDVAAASGVTHVTVMRVYLQVRRFIEDPAAGWTPRSRLRRRD